jgi:hypothetical protein
MTQRSGEGRVCAGLAQIGTPVQVQFEAGQKPSQLFRQVKAKVTVEGKSTGGREFAPGTAADHPVFPSGVAQLSAPMERQKTGGMK